MYEGTYPRTTQKRVLSGWHDVASAALRENVDVRGYLTSHNSVAGPEYCSRGAGLLQSRLSLSDAQLQKVVVARAGSQLQQRVEHLAVER